MLKNNNKIMDKYSVLEKARNIKDMGYLNDEEFETEKSKILLSQGLKKSFKSYEKIERIGKLRENGTVSKEEFETEKRNLIISYKKPTDYKSVSLDFKNKLVNKITSYFNHLVSFQGRIGRSEYALYMVIIFVLFSLCLMFYIEFDKNEDYTLLFLTIALTIFTIYFFISTNVKRLHDMGKEGWWLLVFWSQIYFIITFLVSGTKGENQYGYRYGYKHIDNKK